jgi:hypothetical protein
VRRRTRRRFRQCSRGVESERAGSTRAVRGFGPGCEFFLSGSLGQGDCVATLRLRAVSARSRALVGGRRYQHYAFTEHGAIQAANVLNSTQAVEMGIYVVRAFVKLRELLASNKDLARRFDELEARIEKKLTTHDQAIAAMLSAIRQLLNPPRPKRRPIGFTADLEKTS